MAHAAISVTAVTGPHKHPPNAFSSLSEAAATTDNGIRAMHQRCQFRSVKHCLSLLMSPNYSSVAYLFPRQPAEKDRTTRCGDGRWRLPTARLINTLM